MNEPASHVDKDGNVYNHCSCGGVPGCQRCGGAGRVLHREPCLGCGSCHHGRNYGSTVEYVTCLENALKVARKAQQ